MRPTLLLVVALACVVSAPFAGARPAIDRLHFQSGNTCIDVYIDPFFPPDAGECCKPTGTTIIVARSDDAGPPPPCRDGRVIRIVVAFA